MVVKCNRIRLKITFKNTVNSKSNLTNILKILAQHKLPTISTNVIYDEKLYFLYTIDNLQYIISATKLSILNSKFFLTFTF